MAVSEAETTHGDGCACTRCVGFQPGNGVAVRHGALRADAVIAAEPRTKEILAASRPLRRQPVFLRKRHARERRTGARSGSRSGSRCSSSTSWPSGRRSLRAC